jgi:O-antigen/teichoic acid export membrane protein
MKSQVPLLRNAASLILSQFLTKLINISVSVAMVRWLGARDLGRYSYILAFSFPFGAVADFGLASLGVREISRDRTQEATILAALTRLFLTLAASSVAVMMLLAVAIRHEAWALAGLALAGLSTLLAAMTTPSLVALTAREALHLVAFFRVLATLLGSLATLGVLLAGGSVMSLLLAAAVTSGVMCGVACYLAGLPLAAKSPPLSTHLHLLRQAIPFGLLAIAYAVYYRLDMIILEWLRGSYDVGMYAAAYRFLDATALLAASVGGPFYPRLSRLMVDAPGEARDILEAAWRPLLALGLPASIGMCVLGPPLIRLLFGDGFGRAGDYLQILSWAVLPLLWGNLINHALTAADQVRALVGVYGVGILLNGLGNLLLVPWAGGMGASLALVLSEWVLLGLTFHRLRRRLGIRLSLNGLWRYGVAATILALTLIISREQGLAAAIPLGVIAYLGGLALLGVSKSGDIAAVRRLWTQ